LDFADLTPKQYSVQASVNFGNGEIQKDSFAIDVLPPPTDLRSVGKIALFDPKGETGKTLDGMGVRWVPVDAGVDITQYEMLIIGKGALNLQNCCADPRGRSRWPEGRHLRTDRRGA
jgi:hypothetical protein